MPLFVTLMSNQLLATTLQGELLIIDENNDIYYLPCGDLCEEGGTTTSNDDNESDDDESTSSTSDDVSISTTERYVYLGCYADDSNRVFSGEAYYYITGLTTEVRRGRLNANLTFCWTCYGTTAVRIMSFWSKLRSITFMCRLWGSSIDCANPSREGMALDRNSGIFRYNYRSFDEYGLNPNRP